MKFTRKLIFVSSRSSQTPRSKYFPLSLLWMNSIGSYLVVVILRDNHRTLNIIFLALIILWSPKSILQFNDSSPKRWHVFHLLYYHIKQIFNVIDHFIVDAVLLNTSENVILKLFAFYLSEKRLSFFSLIRRYSADKVYEMSLKNILDFILLLVNLNFLV